MMADSAPKIPRHLALIVGELPAPGTLPDTYPYETVEPYRQGYVERGGVRTWYGQFGDSGPWLVFAPIYQIANSYLLRGVVATLAKGGVSEPSIHQVCCCAARANG